MHKSKRVRVCVCVSWGGVGGLNTLRSSFKSREDAIIFHHVGAVWFNWAQRCEGENGEGSTWTQLRLSAHKHANYGAHTHTHTHKHVSYAADAFVFNVQELLLRELHVQEVLEDKSITEHSTLQSKGKIEVVIII